MNLQSKFATFHEAIKLKDGDENADLREKRERILTRLRDGLKAANRPSFEMFNQGSYAMGTGIKPLKGDYDIDVGIIFNGITIETQADPVVVKGWVFDAVKHHTTRVEFRRPCITVYYVENGEAKYHVDLAVYANDRWSRMYLAKGKQNASSDQRLWERSEPKEFIEKVRNRFSGTDGEQFRRVVGYLKRWKNLKFAAEGNAAPVGIGLTLMAYNWFTPRKTIEWNQATWKNVERYDDLDATRTLVAASLASFTSVWDATIQQYVPRLALAFPVSPGDDVFSRMTNQQMKEFKERLETLRQNLDNAAKATDETTAASWLKKSFGDEFPA